MTARRVAVLAAVGAIGLATATERVRAAGSGSGSSSSEPASGLGLPGPAKSAGKLTVLVVDEAGAPLAGARVTGEVMVNPGPVASTCCTPQRFGEATTDARGRASLPAPPFTFRPVSLTAEWKTWPARKVGLGGPMRAPGEVRIVLGPKAATPVPTPAPAAPVAPAPAQR